MLYYDYDYNIDLATVLLNDKGLCKLYTIYIIRYNDEPKFTGKFASVYLS